MFFIMYKGRKKERLFSIEEKRKERGRHRTKKRKTHPKAHKRHIVQPHL
jgi:hypothetical protein